MAQGTIRIALLSALCAGSAWAEGPTIRIDSGLVSGLENGPATVFRAIPYVAPPVGPLRWKPPKPVKAWPGVRKAETPGPACPQKVMPGVPNLGGYFGPTSEDCLTLDVTAPRVAPDRKAGRAPVMVWVYGGGNIAGATNLPSYDAANFARDGVIVVAMNYRLGPLGFFAHPSLTAEAPRDQSLASYGLMDQIAALKWVKRNIAAFGGDAGNVTLFGESAGGQDVLQLMATAAARGLFQRAIVQSGGGWDRPIALAEAETRGVALATRLGLAGAGATTDQLRAVQAEDLIARSAGGGPVVDGRLIRRSAREAFAGGEAAAVPLIIGSNSNEASLMAATGMAAPTQVAKASPALRAAYGAEAGTEAGFARALFNDGAMGAPARWIAARASARAPAWLYYFSYVPERQRGIRPGTNHASEIPFVFESLDAVPGRTPLITPSERAAATLAHSCWVAFARAGRPDCAGGQAWPTYGPSSDQLLEFGDPAGVRSHFRKAQLDAQDAAAGAKP